MRLPVRCLTLIAAVLAVVLGAAGPSAGADKVVFKTDFSPVGYHSMFYAAVGRGTFGRHGLEVQIIPGTGSHAAVLDIAGGKIDVAFADTSTLALAALNAGVRDVKVVAMVFEVTPFSILYLKNKGIAKPPDLAGRTMANFQGSGVGRMFKAFARLNGVDASGVKEILSSPPTYLNPLVVGQADFAPSTVNQTVNLAEPARQAGNEIAQFRFVDHGLDMFGAAIITSTKTIAERPDVVKRFVAATLESVQWSAKNPGEAVDQLLKVNPQIQKPRALGDFRAILETSIPRAGKAANPLALGWVDAAKMKRTIDLVREAYDLKQTIEPGSLYTNDYVVKP